MLMGLKIRNGFGEKDLAAAVAAALHRGVAKHTCEDCGVKVASGATSSYERVSGGGSPRGRSSPLGLAIWRLFLFPAGTHFAHPISCKPPTFLPHNEREI
jgi:hypothetical protein